MSIERKRPLCWRSCSGFVVGGYLFALDVPHRQYVGFVTDAASSKGGDGGELLAWAVHIIASYGKWIVKGKHLILLKSVSKHGQMSTDSVGWGSGQQSVSHWWHFSCTFPLPTQESCSFSHGDYCQVTLVLAKASTFPNTRVLYLLPYFTWVFSPLQTSLGSESSNRSRFMLCTVRECGTEKPRDRDFMCEVW